MSIENLTLAHFRHFSSLYTVLRSTTVENSLQISPFYAKQSQSQVGQNQHKHFYNNEIRKKGQLVIQTKQTQFKANKAKNKPNSNPIKAKTNPIQTQFQMFYLRWENIMLASAVIAHIIVVRNILNCNDRLAKPWSKITLCNPESASRPTFRIILLVLPVLSKERFMHGD